MKFTLLLSFPLCSPTCAQPVGRIAAHYRCRRPGRRARRAGSGDGHARRRIPQAELEDARAAVAKTVEAVLKLTRDLKIDPKLVRSTRINVQPEYNWDAGNADEAQADRLLRGAAGRSGTARSRSSASCWSAPPIRRQPDRRSAPGFQKRQELVREALAKAVADARQNAEVSPRLPVPSWAGRTISANTKFTQPLLPMVRADGDGSQAAGAAPYQSGEMTFNATVNVQYG